MGPKRLDSWMLGAVMEENRQEAGFGGRAGVAPGRVACDSGTSRTRVGPRARDRPRSVDGATVRDGTVRSGAPRAEAQHPDGRRGDWRRGEGRRGAPRSQAGVGDEGGAAQAQSWFRAGPLDSATRALGHPGNSDRTNGQMDPGEAGGRGGGTALRGALPPRGGWRRYGSPSRQRPCDGLLQGPADPAAPSREWPFLPLGAEHTPAAALVLTGSRVRRRDRPGRRAEACGPHPVRGRVAAYSPTGATCGRQCPEREAILGDLYD